MTTTPAATPSGKIANSETNPASAAATIQNTEPPIEEEEDWSLYMNTDSSCGTKTLHKSDARDQSFSYYDTVLVPLSVGKQKCFTKDRNPLDESQSQPPVMEIRCVKSLTPLDMMDLSNGLSDATGNRMWMGAVFFLECMVRKVLFQEEESRTFQSTHNCWQEQQRRALVNLRTKLFHNKRVLELGSGTGAALIAIGLAGSRKGEISSPLEAANEYGPADTVIRPSFLTFTDNDANVLSLCQVNCDQNLKSPKNSLVDYRVGKLDWGDFCNSRDRNNELATTTTDNEDSFFLDSDELRGTLDTVVATDVIYDVAAIPLLVATAEGLLKEGGFLVLAHVPRASIDCDPSMIRDALEELIMSEATKVGFETNFSGDSCWRENIDDMESLQVLFGGAETNETTRPRTTRPSIVRPSSLTQLWATASEGQDENLSLQSKMPVLSVSSDYDYEELESCGASIMIFIKKSKNNCTTK